MAAHNTAWNEVETYLADTLVRSDDALKEAVRATAEAGMPAIEVAPTQGKLLMLLARIRGARRALEIGTLGGFSTIWLARGLPDDGTLVTCEYEPRHAAVAQANLERAGVAHKVDIRVGAALDTLLQLDAAAPFDLVFIDADKANNANYVDAVLRLTRSRSLIIVDNVVRDGSVLGDGTREDGSVDEDVRGTRKALELLGSDPRLDATAIQTVGSKGWDGFALAVVN